ncbi:putative thiopurine S-methyltransferase [Holothuria leucospilota]|uniref:thiopurine S-methyltransferase n=1 Tax=Holothuria leucospilota TaxID=206669 RepID=A0A9Q1BUA9_HOLLE|nr:putative thiopurine S-methyltransferase [Holothuria leucospilota]
MSTKNGDRAYDLEPNSKRHKGIHQSEFEINDNVPKEKTSNVTSKKEDVKQNGVHHEDTVKRNQFGDVVSDPNISLEGWINVWKKGRTKFHRREVHSILTNFLPKLVEGKENPTFFVPLCGKSVDMKWLLDNGYEVYGCEIAEDGILQFFEEQEISYVIEPLEGKVEGKIYKGKDLPIVIFMCDFFKLPSVSSVRFDCVWDRGSFAAINTKDRSRYYDVLKKMMKPDGRWLLDSFELDHVKFAGPPFNLDTTELKQLVDDDFSIEQVRYKDAMNDWSRTWDVSYFIVKDFLLTRKEKTMEK